MRWEGTIRTESSLVDATNPLDISATVVAVMSTVKVLKPDRLLVGRPNDDFGQHGMEWV